MPYKELGKDFRYASGWSVVLQPEVEKDYRHPDFLRSTKKHDILQMFKFKVDEQFEGCEVRRRSELKSFTEKGNEPEWRYRN